MSNDIPEEKKRLREKLENTNVASNYINVIEEIFDTSVSIWNLPLTLKFTDHSVLHSCKVLYFAIDIAKGLEEPLNDLESLLLCAGGLLHDTGMQFGNFIKKDDQTGYPDESWCDAREKHAERSVSILKALLGDFGEVEITKGLRIVSLSPLYAFLNTNNIPVPGFIQNLSTIILSHTKDSLRKETGWFEACKVNGDEGVRLDLLSALLRFADELHLGQTRIKDWGMFERDEVPVDSLEHWLAASLVSTVKVNVHKSAVSITIVPDYNMIPEEQELSDFCFYLIFRQYKKLDNSLTKPIISDMSTITEIFSKNGLAAIITTQQFQKKGRLKKTTISDTQLSALSRILQRMIESGFGPDSIAMELFEFANMENVKLCLVKETEGLRIPKYFKERIVNWIKANISKKTKATHFHTAFHRIVDSKNEIEEYLPDGVVSPTSILGAAAATMSFNYDIEQMNLVPSDIVCGSELKRDKVNITFPEFKRKEKLQGEVFAVGPWDVVKIKYDPLVMSKEEQGKTVGNINGIITSLGKVTFLTIPSDQGVDLGLGGDDRIMQGAGVLDFFSNPNHDVVSKREWKKTRELLLDGISKNARNDYKIEGTLVCSIVGYSYESKTYKVITWKDNNPKFPEFIHFGVVASSLHVLCRQHREYFVGSPFLISKDVFPEDDKIEMEMWGSRNSSFFNVNLNSENNLAISIEATKLYDVKMALTI